MVELKVRMSTKGQIVIPKIFRDSNKMYPQEEFLIKIEQGKVIIEKQEEDIVAKLREIAIKINEGKKRKQLSAKQMKEIFYEQYEERAKRSGINIRR